MRAVTLIRPLLILAAMVGGGLPVGAQDGLSPIPERRAIAVPDTDFFGGDLRSIFDTEIALCERACLAENACRAYTFNGRAAACFLKSGVERIEPFEGALSAVIVDTAQALRDEAAERAAALAFLPEGDLEAARAQVLALGRETALPVTSVAEIGEIPQTPTQGLNDIATLNRLAARVNRSDAAADWLAYGRLALTIRGSRSRQRAMRRLATSAYINAWLRGQAPYVRGMAMMGLAEVLEMRGRGKLTIPALRLAVAADPRPLSEQALARALRLYGFQVTETDVQSDAAAPRICLTFSEDLAAAGVDYAPFVRMGSDDLPVTADGALLCIDGVVHGQTYSVQLREGLPSASGETLDAPVDLEIYVRDRTPSLRFTGRAYVLAKSPDASIPLVSVNLAEVALEIHRIGARNLMPAIQDGTFGASLDSYREGRLAARMGAAVWSGTAEVARRVNADVTTALPIGEAIADFEPGVYVMTARVPGDPRFWRAAATQWFVVTDLGLATVAGTDGLHVMVRGLTDAAARPDVTLTLLAQNNEVLGRATTDSRGYVQFAPGLTRGVGGMEPALLTAEDAAGDFVFLSLADAAMDLSDRGVEGRVAPPPIDVFLATERGVYRPGETVYATILARDGQARAVTGLPLTAIIRRPDGVEHSRIVLPDTGAGGRVLTLALPGSAQRGGWQIAIHADPKAAPLTTASVLVEDFIPERIDFDLTLDEGPVDLGATLEIAVDARYLYGAPGADLAIEGEVTLAGTRELPGWPGVTFGLADEQVYPVSESLGGIRTGPEGRALIPLPLPDAPSVTQPLSFTATIRLTEGSGRPVERNLTRPVAPSGPMLGIRPLFEDVVEEGGLARFEILAVGPDLQAVDMPRLGWTVNRVQTRWQWYQLDGRWNFEPITRRTRIANGEIALSGGPVRIEAPVEWGRYELKLVSLEDGAVQASTVFSAGWYAPEAGTDTPDRLTVGLDADRYAPGDTARLRIEAEEAGTLVISVFTDRLVDFRAQAIKPGVTTIDLPVTEGWHPGAYVSASLIRPMDARAGRNPSRAIGIAWAGIDPGPAALATRFDMPAEVAPRAPMEAVLRVDAPAGAEVWATIAAVDVGILNITGHAAPDPQAHYFGQRKLGVELRDLYGRLIDGLAGDPGRLREGGDGDLDRSQAAPPVDELVAFFSGPIRVGPDGTARAVFEMPDFNGTVKLMAVTWSEAGIGQAETELLVRDPVVITTAAPRFLAPGDSSILRVDLAHAKGPYGDMALEITADAAVSLPPGLSGTVPLARLGRAELEIPIEAVRVADAAVTVALTTPNGTRLVKRHLIGVRAYDPEIARTSRIPLAARDGRLVLDAQAFDGIIPGTGRATLALGPFARFDAPGLLAALDRYPYGCTEQITSRALPLLYVGEVAQAMGIVDAADPLNTRIAAAIQAVLANQSGAGSFGLWRPAGGDLWLDAYVTDFLSRARALGHAVPDIAFRLAVQNLRNGINTASDFERGGQGIAYALMVLARENAAAIGDLRYYADQKADDFATPLSLAQLGLALAYYGDQPRADALFRMAGRGLEQEDDLGWRVDYGSRARDAAAILTLAVEARSDAVDRGRLARIALPRAGQLRLRSTQENAWALMAAHALIDQAEGMGLSIDGVPMTGPLVRLFEPGDARVIIANEGPQPVDAALTVFGVPDQPEPAGGDGYKIERAYYTLDGAPADLAAVPRSTRLVAVLTITPERDREARLMINDPLPAGFEIDNPNLLRAGDITALGWLDIPDVARHAEFRAERFLAAVDWRGTNPFRLAYVVRAVSPGDFHHPAASVEDMYRPIFRARTAASRLVVSE
ncbi:MAG: alpha-2-macroglobulin family protein [Pseudomonadota bacterium]